MVDENTLFRESERYDSFLERVALLDFGDVRGIDILDIGAGKGEMALIAASKFNCHVTCIDPNPVKLANAKETVIKSGIATISFELADARKLAYLDNYFTCVVCFSVLHHVAKQEQEKVIDEIIRVANQKVLVSELLPEGAKYFDEVLHPGENHQAKLIDQAWLKNRLNKHGEIKVLNRKHTYFIMLMKNDKKR